MTSSTPAITLGTGASVHTESVTIVMHTIIVIVNRYRHHSHCPAIPVIDAVVIALVIKVTNVIYNVSIDRGGLTVSIHILRGGVDCINPHT